MISSTKKLQKPQQHRNLIISTAPIKRNIKALEDDDEDPPAWIAALFDKPNGRFRCTGVLVTDTYILTAAHCVINHELPYFQYIGFNDDNDSKGPIIPIESYILYQPNYDIALLKLAKPYVRPDVAVGIYHGYTLYSYKHITVPNKLYISGYGGDNTQEVADALAEIELEPKTLDVDYSQLKSTITDGKTFGGDSGGPVNYNGEFGNNSYSKLVAIHSGTTIDGLSVDVVLDSGILKWLSNITGRMIFELPIDQGSISVSNGAISFSGWGKVSSAEKIEVYNDSLVLVAKCLTIDQITTNTWKCQAKFNDGYNYELASKYHAKLLDSHAVVDDVYFEVESDIDVEIIHPTNGFTYHTPVNESYVISGSAIPGESLIYSLFTDNGRTLLESNPCIGNSLVDVNGLWQCRIKNSFIESSYYFIVRYLNSEENSVTLASVDYFINPESSLWLNIITPKADSMNPTHDIYINFSKTKASKSVKFLWYTKDFNAYRSNEVYIDVPGNHDEISAPDEYVDYIKQYNNPKVKVYLKVGLYLDGDDKAAVESLVSYYIVTNSIYINPPAIDNLHQGGSISLSGSVVIDSSPNEWEIGMLVKNPNNTTQEYGPITINNDFSWSASGYPIHFSQSGNYNITVTLYHTDLEDPVAESNLNLHIAKDAHILTPKH